MCVCIAAIETTTRYYSILMCGDACYNASILLLETSPVHVFSQGDHSDPSPTAFVFSVAVLECGYHDCSFFGFTGTFAPYNRQHASVLT